MGYRDRVSEKRSSGERLAAPYLRCGAPRRGGISRGARRYLCRANRERSARGKRERETGARRTKEHDGLAQSVRDSVAGHDHAHTSGSSSAFGKGPVGLRFALRIRRSVLARYPSRRAGRAPGDAARDGAFCVRALRGAHAYREGALRLSDAGRCRSRAGGFGPENGGFFARPGCGEGASPSRAGPFPREQAGHSCRRHVPRLEEGYQARHRRPSDRCALAVALASARDGVAFFERRRFPAGRGVCRRPVNLTVRSGVGG